MRRGPCTLLWYCLKPDRHFPFDGFQTGKPFSFQTPIKPQSHNQGQQDPWNLFSRRSPRCPYLKVRLPYLPPHPVLSFGLHWTIVPYHLFGIHTTCCCV